MIRKRIHPPIYLLTAMLFCTSCLYHHGDTNISYSENDESYTMKAWFPQGAMRNVEEYLNDRIGDESNMSFVNTRIDGTLTLGDHTTFYIKKSPGELRITLDKDKNSKEGYREIKSLCEGIKKVIAGNQSE